MAVRQGGDRDGAERRLRRAGWPQGRAAGSRDLHPNGRALEPSGERGIVRGVEPEQIREFVRRSREPVERLKAEWWASHAGSKGPGSSLEVGHALLEHARRVDPSFPGPEYLEADLAHHVFLKERIDRVSAALTRR